MGPRGSSAVRDRFPARRVRRLACLVAGIALLGTSPAAAQPQAARNQLEAQTLAGLIRGDAREAGPRSTTLVRARNECCGRRLIDVYYRVKTAPKTLHCPPEPNGTLCVEPPTEGAYHLRLLETLKGHPLHISVNEFGTEPGYVLGTEPDTHASGLGYRFTMDWRRTLPENQGESGWTVSVYYSELTLGAGRTGEGTIYELHQAIAVCKKAARHTPVIGEAADFRL